MNNVLKLCQIQSHKDEAMDSGFQCAACGEWNPTAVDTTAGYNQLYVEDCQTCCKPNVLHITYDPELKEYTIAAELE